MGSVVTGTDVTNSRLWRALGSSPDVVIVVDQAGTVLEVGPSMTPVFGYGPGALEGRSGFEFVHPDDVLLTVEALGDALAVPGRPTEHVRIRLADSDGNWRPVEVLVNNLTDDPDVAGLVLTLRDRAGDEAVEREVREREDRYRQVAELALEGVWYLDEVDRTTFATGRLASMLGVTVADMVGRSVLEFLHPDDRLDAEEMLARRHRGRHEEHLVRLQHRAGRDVWARLSATPVHSPDGRFLGSIAVVSDVTEQQHAAERLAATEAREQAILNALPDMLFRVRRDGTVMEHRSGRGDVLPVSERADGRHLRELVPANLAEAALRAVAHALRTGRVTAFTYSLPVDGVERHFEARVSSIDADEVVALVRDVTDVHEAARSREEYRHEVQRRQAAEEKAELERGLARATRLEALGRLAGGVAHDMNNLLGVISNYATAIRRSTREELTASDVLEIEQVVRRGTQLTKRLLLFGRQDHATVEVQDLAGIAAGVGDMLDRTIGPLHHLRTDLCDEPVPVSVDRWQVEQAIINLVLNSRDAAPPGTRIEVAVRVEDDRALLSVSDEGPGMPPDVQERAFEPFFTTKEPGTGTGLGLAVVHGVAVEAGGSVQIDSEPDRGTTVTIVLPLHPDAVAAVPPEVRSPEPEASDASVLVVDDQADTRRSLARLLESQGFEVHVAASGAEALRLLDGALPVDVVVSDVAMPVMNGPDLVRRLAEGHADLPVVLLTGFASDLIADLPEGVPVLAKPLVVDELVGLLSGLVSGGAR
jgi:two-component system, cell cycle sensor histidine kinase and response regulator CckA